MTHGAHRVLDAAKKPILTSETLDSSRLSFLDLVQAVRVRQWAKNSLLLGGFLFAGKLRAPAPEMWSSLSRVLLAIACFCALSGATYLVNDWSDIARDRAHPTKCRRPLASGRMSTRFALGFIAFLFAFAVFCVGVLWWRETENHRFRGRGCGLSRAHFGVFVSLETRSHC